MNIPFITEMRQRKELLNTLLENSAALTAGIKKLASWLERAAAATAQYIQYEKAQRDMLLEKTAAFSANLDVRGAELLESAKTLHQKITASCTSLEFVEHAAGMLKDMNEAFPALVERDYSEKTRQLQRVLDSLNTLAYKCVHFQTLPKPYNDIISLYSTRIESFLGKPQVQEKLAEVFIKPDDAKAMPETKPEPEEINVPEPAASAVAEPAVEAAAEPVDEPEDEIWRAHYADGLRFLAFAPDRAIIAFSRAIRRNPRNPAQYYYRGMAYQSKQRYEAALADYEKALAVNNGKNEYMQRLITLQIAELKKV